MRIRHRTGGGRRLPASRILVLGACLLAAGPSRLASETGRAARGGERMPASFDHFDVPTPGWREGPVRYLLTQEEDQAFRRLATDAERGKFIVRFWASRDPAPSTPENEYRSLFLRRAEDATSLFRTESTKPGWKTDRGKIYILLGPPDDLSQASIQITGPEIITWIYRDPPPGTGASPNSQVNFLRDPSGEYRLSTRVRTFLSETAMSRALALQALQMASLPGTHAVEEGSGPPESAGAAAPLRMQAGFFRAGNGRTLVVLTLWARESLFTPDHGGDRNKGGPGGAAFREAVARLVAAGGTGSGPEGSEGSTVLRAGDDSLSRGPDGCRVFQGGLVIRPGDYGVEIALLKTDSSPLQSLQQSLSVPELEGDTLAVGPITFASHLERLSTSTWPEYTAPFVLGRLRVVPRTDDRLRQGEELAFYYQVLGAMTDPIEGLPDFDLEYRFRFAAAAPDGSIHLQGFGNPIHLTHEQNLVQGFSLPLTGWSPGAYRLEVIVTDNLTGGTARSEVPFEVR
ncbi:MAG TPA: GWxTD domain-containing protein [Candidatus Cryosericum sp.]|nr:GWxTD domain-containing protein [Candidatus Cryosericum sp.]